MSESVELAKRVQPRGAGLVNAVLRRATREAPARSSTRFREATPARGRAAPLAPDWIARLWWDALGAEDARAR